MLLHEVGDTVDGVEVRRWVVEDRHPVEALVELSADADMSEGGRRCSWRCWETGGPRFRRTGLSETAVAITAEARYDASGGAGPGAWLTFVGVGGDLWSASRPGAA